MAFLGGFPIAAIIYGLFAKYGFQGVFASILAGITSLSIFIFIIYRKWKIEKDVLPQIVHGMEKKHAIGNFLLLIGNVIAILSILATIATSIFKIEPVVGGVIVLVGSLVTILFWLGGWSWIDSSLVKFRKL